MRRIVLIVLACASSVVGGCQAAGQYPGIAPSFYAYTFFNGQVSEVFQFPPPFVEGSCMQALADLGFYSIETSREGAATIITARTPDGPRPARITIEPQNAMTLFRVRIGRGLLGDEPLSKALIDRIAQNFGTIPRTIIPLEPTLARRGPLNISAAPPTNLLEPIAPPGTTVVAPGAPLAPTVVPPTSVDPELPLAPGVPAPAIESGPAPIVPTPPAGAGPFTPPRANHRAEARPARSVGRIA